MSLQSFSDVPDMTDMEIFRMFMAAIGQEWEQPEPTTTGHCFDVRAMDVYFDDEGDFIVAHAHD